jgi:hypothetical protein
LQESTKRALAFLFKHQTTEGAWWGRWGVNYIYGTTNVLRGLATFCNDKEVARVALRAVLWLEACQDADGGWGEATLSYEDASLAGQGPSTAAQTAWALDTLLHFRPASDPALQTGARWLVVNQNPKSEERRHSSSWPSDNLYVGTGFPQLLYLGYPFYHHYFAISSAGTCALDSGLPAQWPHADSGLGLSGVAAASLVASNILCWEDLNKATRVDWAATRRAKPLFRVFCAVASRLGIVLFRILLAVLGWLP